MHIEGDDSVISTLKEKKRLQDSNVDSSHIRILCIVDGGLMKGAYATGAGLALEELGYTGVFETIVGVSSGAPAAAYFVAGQVSTGSTLMHEECCSSEFINLKRFWSPLNTDAVLQAMRVGRKKIEWSNITLNTTDLYIGVTRHSDAKPHLVSVKGLDTMLTAIEASIAIPTLTNKRIFIGNEQYTDGGFASPHIVQHALDTLPASHVIIFTNQDKDTEDVPLLEKFLNRTVWRKRYSSALLKSANNRRVARHKLVENILAGQYSKPICVVWGNSSVSSTERSSTKVKSTVDASYQYWKQLLRD